MGVSGNTYPNDLVTQKVSEKKGAIIDFIDRIGAFRCLLILYLLFIIVHTLINGYCKHIETYMDEWYYYGLAESLAKGMGFPAIYGEKLTSITRYLYSILISPGLIASGGWLQFRLIAMLNAIYIGSGIFPVYLLAKKVLEEERYAFLAAAFYLFQPDMEFTATFMTENIWLPVSLWVIYFFFQIVCDTNQATYKKVRTWFLLLLSLTVLIYIKDSGISIVMAIALYYLFYEVSLFIRSIKRHGINRHRIVIVILMSLLVICFCLLFLFSPAIIDKVSVEYTAFLSIFQLDFGRYLWCYCFTWATEILAIGVFPFALPLLSFRQLNMHAKQLFVITLIMAAVANIGVADTSLATTVAFDLPDFRLHQRYVIYLWTLYIIIFLYVLKTELKISAIKAVISVFIIAAFCFAFKGAVIGSVLDMSLLFWALQWMEHRWIWISVVTLFVVVGFVLLRRKGMFCLFFFGVMSIVVIYDHHYVHQLIKGGYQFDYAKIKDVDDYIRENEEDSFLLVQLPSTDKADDVHYNSKIADTILSYPNTIFASGEKICGTETKQGIDLNAVSMDDLGISIVGAYNLDSVDYIVLTTEMIIDETMCEKVLENGFFNIYRLVDKTKIPYIARVNQWNIPGKVLFQPEAGFCSHYYEGDSMTFVSGNNPDYVLYGPYASLSPGQYKVTIHYSYSGDNSGKIGMMDLFGSELDSLGNRVDVYASEEEVSISFELTEQCDSFEVRLFAEVSGIEVEFIEVETAKPTELETSNYEIRRFVGSNDLIIREEYFSLNGDKTVNTSGYHAVEYDYEYGNRVKSCYYDMNNQMVKTSSGYSIVRYSYNSLRQVIREDYYDQNDEPVMCTGGYYAAEFDCDAYGNRTETRYLDKDGERIILSAGQAMIRQTYNDKRQVIREEYYDKDYKPLMRSEGYFAVEYEYDEDGNRPETRYYDTQNQLVTINSGFAIKRSTFDDSRKIIREEYYDEADERVLCTSGYSAIEYERDANGDAVETRYYGMDDERIVLSVGQAMIRQTYNEKHQVTREEYYDKEYNPLMRTEGYFAVEYEYDENGNRSETRYYDTHNQLVIISSGFAIKRSAFDASRRIIREEYYDEADERVLCTSGYSAIEYDRDANGNPVETRYYGMDDERIVLSAGQAMIRQTYNEKHQVIREEYYDEEYKPLMCTNGYFAVEYEYDSNGNRIKYRYYDLNGDLVPINSGYAILRREYNEIKQVIRECYFDQDDKPVAVNGCYVIEYDRDEAGHAIAERYYDSNNELTENSSGIAYTIRKFDQNGELLEEKLFQLDGKEVLP